ncbi:hypothetical protein SLA2020_129830 [Shorea laevis]
MKWDMEIEEIEAVLEKIWDLHDKLSDAIHSISRAHFLDSIKSLRKTDKNKLLGDENRAGFVIIKDFRVDDSDAAIQEAKSLSAIRTALENLEDQLEVFHTVQIQQQAARDAAIARLEQSRNILAMRLAEHHGKKYKVIEEALAFVGNVHDTGHFVSPENLYDPPCTNMKSHEGKASGIPIKVLFSSFDFAKRSLKLDHMGGILRNAALFAVSMIVMLHLHRIAHKEEPSKKQKDNINNCISLRKTSHLEVPSSNDRLRHLDVMLARG